MTPSHGRRGSICVREVTDLEAGIRTFGRRCTKLFRPDSVVVAEKLDGNGSEVVCLPSPINENRSRQQPRWYAQYRTGLGQSLVEGRYRCTML